MTSQYNTRNINHNDFEGDVLSAFKPKEGMFRRKPKLPMSVDGVIAALKDGLMISSNRFVISHRDDVVSVTDTSINDHRRTKTASLDEYREYLEGKGDKFIHCTIKTKDVTMVHPNNVAVPSFVTDSLLPVGSPICGLDWGTIFPRDLLGSWIKDVVLYYPEVQPTEDSNNQNGWGLTVPPVRNDIGIVWHSVSESFTVHALIVTEGVVVKETKITFNKQDNSYIVEYDRAKFTWKYLTEIVDVNSACLVHPLRYGEFSSLGINTNVAEVMQGLRAISNPAVKAVRVARTLVFINWADLIAGRPDITKKDVEHIEASVLPTDIAWLNGTYVYPKMCLHGVYLECPRYGVNLDIKTSEGVFTVGVSIADKRVCVTEAICMNFAPPIEYNKSFWAKKVFQLDMVEYFNQTSCEEFSFTSDQFTI